MPELDQKTLDALKRLGQELAAAKREYAETWTVKSDYQNYSPVNVLDFMGFTKPFLGGLVKFCFDCTTDPKNPVSGVRVGLGKNRKWWHIFIPLLWKSYGLMDRDPYCDSYECPKCGQRWRTPKEH